MGRTAHTKDKLRTDYISFRVTKDEKKAIRRRKEKSGIHAMGEYIRTTLLKEAS